MITLDIDKRDSTYVKILKSICVERDIEITAFSDNWFFRLSRDGVTRYIYGYRFDLNTSAAQSICTDKCAASDILSVNRVPCVGHVYFISPSEVRQAGWERMSELLKKHGKLVCKPNEGTGGNNVYAASTQAELECAANKIFKVSASMAVCPFYSIENEYRVVMLDGRAKLVFSKRLPSAVGNGRSTVAELLFEYIKEKRIKSFNFEPEDGALQRVLAEGEVYRLNWKHNLAQGAEPLLVRGGALADALTALAVRAVDALNIRFASVDIITDGDDYRVLEVNSGVMMNYFASFSEENYGIAKRIYGEAIGLMFAEA